MKKLIKAKKYVFLWFTILKIYYFPLYVTSISLEWGKNEPSWGETSHAKKEKRNSYHVLTTPQLG